MSLFYLKTFEHEYMKIEIGESGEVKSIFSIKVSPCTVHDGHPHFKYIDLTETETLIGEKITQKEYKHAAKVAASFFSINKQLPSLN